MKRSILRIPQQHCFLIQTTYLLAGGAGMVLFPAPFLLVSRGRKKLIISYVLILIKASHSLFLYYHFCGDPQS